jgi:WD40 repeat protein
MKRQLILAFVAIAMAAGQQTQPVAQFTLDEPVVQVMLSPDARHLIVATSRTHAVQYDVAAKRELRKYDVPEQVNAAEFSPDGTLLAVGTLKGSYRVWDVASGKVVHQGEGEGVVVQHLCLSRDNRKLAFANNVNGNQVIDLPSGEAIGPFRSAIGSAWGMAFSEDGKWLATADDDTAVHLWDAADGRMARQFDDSLLAEFAVRFSRDGKTLVKGGAARTIDVVDLGSGKITKSLPVGRYAVRAIILSPSARYAAVQTMDPNGMFEASPLQVWDLRSGNKIAELTASSGSAAAFKDESTLFVGDLKEKTATVVAVTLPK